MVFSSHSTLLFLQLWEDPKYPQLSIHSHPQPPPLIEANKGDTHSPPLSTSITPKSKHTLRPCLLLGVVLLLTTEVTTPPHLFPCMVAGEGGRKEKGEWILVLLEDEEKVKTRRASATSTLRSYVAALAFVLESSTTLPPASMPYESIRFLTWLKNPLTVWKCESCEWMKWVR